MPLTQEQLNFFDTFGYLMIPQLFPSDETNEIIEKFEWTIRNRGGGLDHDGSRRTMFLKPIEHRPDMCALLDHPTILDLIGSILGDDFNYCGGDGNYYSGDTGWHPDGSWGATLRRQGSVLSGSAHPRHRGAAIHSRQPQARPLRSDGEDRRQQLARAFRRPAHGVPRQRCHGDQTRRRCGFQSRPLSRLVRRGKPETHVHHELHPPRQNTRGL